MGGRAWVRRPVGSWAGGCAYALVIGFRGGRVGHVEVIAEQLRGL